MDWALFLDVDGTLLDLAPKPGEVVVPRTLRPRLETLRRRFGGALALVSGRALSGVDQLFPGGHDAAGSHGAEWRLAGTTTVLADPWPDEVATMVVTAAGLLPGILVERKPRSVALHYRDAPEREPAVKALAEAAIRNAGTELRLLEGKAVIEIASPEADKGMAIDRFMRVPPYAGRRPVFAGDDITDESGFAAVNRLDGLSLHVGRSLVTRAHFRLSTPVSLRRWLARLDQAPGGVSDHELP
ncbi:trehalose-phosphatase [Magnetospirillum sp. 15-1]|uniref:trehalose-phosphatase n=1 Tax=Magnetospirillum sp. 15-1 TaxID=1979370 RepID=UPI000BBC5A45|nr:trehalose-phosphatase [Magnetospirillum sp. 15-1]